MKRVLRGVLLLGSLCAVGCGGEGLDGSEALSGESAETIQEWTERPTTVDAGCVDGSPLSVFTCERPAKGTSVAFDRTKVGVAR